VIEWKSREDLPHVLNSLNLFGLGVEVGTQLAQYASRVRAAWKGEKLYCVDPWRAWGGDTTDDQYEAYFQRARETMKAFPEKSWEFIRATSVSAATSGRFAHGSLDWVYVDADHSYEAVKADIAAWWPLIKSGGILAGHDWVSDGWHRNGEPFTAHEAPLSDGPCWQYGVRRAVAEEFLGPDSVTDETEDSGWQSWLVRKP